MTDAEEAVKFMLKSRLSHIVNNIDRSTISQIEDSLGRVYGDLVAYTRGLPESTK